MKQLIKDEKLKDEKEWLANLPFKAGYILILLIVLAFLCKGYNKVVATKEKVVIDREK